MEGLKSAVCFFCANKVVDACKSCESKNNTIEDNFYECTSNRSACGHYFHFHCVVPYLRENPNCPICNSEFEFEKFFRRDQIPEDSKE